MSAVFMRKTCMSIFSTVVHELYSVPLLTTFWGKHQSTRQITIASIVFQDFKRGIDHIITVI